MQELLTLVLILGVKTCTSDKIKVAVLIYLALWQRYQCDLKRSVES